MFKDIYKRKDLIKHVSPAGSRFRVKRGWMYEDGELVYKEKGLTNVYEEIQSYKDQVDIHAIMKRYENGDDSALERVQGMYIDTVDLPKNYAQLYDAISKSDSIFNALPAEIKAEYNGNAAAFWKNFGTESFDNIINNYRQNELSRYGIDDPEPVNTVEKMKEVNAEPVKVEPVKDVNANE